MLWGFKTVAIFDVWSFEHLLMGLSIGMVTVRLNSKILNKKYHLKTTQRKSSYFDIITVLFIAYIWESVEHYLEVGIIGSSVEYWFQGIEYWANRLISDPIITIVGYYVAKSKPFLVNPARVLSLIWICIHVFIFPHSMYLHELFWK